MSAHFMRAMGIVSIHRIVRTRYQLPENQLKIPESVFENPMNLIPLREINAWYERLETSTQNPDIILESVKDVDLEKLGAIGRWLYSGNDLATAIRRVNHGLSIFQSGAYLSATLSGNIIKWQLNNPNIGATARVHDSVRFASFMLKVLKGFLGQDYVPVRIMLSGYRKNEALYEEFFGCPIGWNHSATEIWFHNHDRLGQRQTKQKRNQSLAMNLFDMDEMLNMPSSNDEVKVIYEVINYSCHYGLPTVERVAELLGLSTQQFQRRLHKVGLNFTTISAYVQSNLAVTLMNKGATIDEIAPRLGYTNTASFNRMFKRVRGITPTRYISEFIE